MAFITGTLADGQVSNSQAAIYTVDDSVTAANVRQVFFYNTSATQQTVVVVLNVDGANDRQFRTFVLEQDESCELLEEPLQLGPNDTIEAVTTTDAVVDYVITGVVEA